MKCPFHFLTALITCCLIAASATAREFHVATAGDDAATGAGTHVNLARGATATGRGTHPEAAIDGIKNIHGKGEWIGGSPNAWYGWIDFPSLKLTWKQPVTVNQVRIHDRPTLDEHLAGAILKFSDGSEVSVTAIPNDGSPRTVTFPPREITSLELSAVDGIGTKIGLAEIEVFHDPGAKPPVTHRQLTDFVSHVDPTIETGRGRWFFCTPGSLPFGMISASAYTRNKNQGGGGYNYNSTEIRGFTQQKCWIMSSVNLMPVTGDIHPNLGEAGWLSKFSHDTETIEPGYHQVFLDRYKTKVEYTATGRVAYYRLTYQEAATARLLLQLGGFVGSASYVDGHATLVSPTRIEGHHGMTDRLWGGPELSHVYFVIETDRPIARMDGWRGADESLPDIRTFANPVAPERLQQDMRGYLFKNLPEEQAGVALAYDVAAGDVVHLKIAISFTNIANARNNMAQDGAESDFDKVRAAARATWNDWLGKIAVKGGPVETRVKFYTDLWHVLLGRHRLDDASGDYPSFMPDHRFRVRPVARDPSGKPIHAMYNSDALWLTMWNLNILWGLAWPGVMDDFSASWVQYARDGGHLPRGPSAGGYTGIMTGSPGTSLLAATYQKGLMKKSDPHEAWRLMKASNEKLIQLDAPGVAVQGAFEYWALAQMAADLGMEDEAAACKDAIDGWKKFYNPEHQLLMAPGVNDPLSGRGWVEANAWQGSFGVSHDIPGLAALMGGNEALADKLNQAFETEAPNHFVFTYGAGRVSYANQPGCSNAHVFNHVGHPWLSQYWVRRVSKQAYGGTCPNTGYGGHDEDQGQMGGVSALMKLGLFSIRGNCSREPSYEITTPEFEEITISLDPRYYPGKQFVIRSHDHSPENIYIQKAALNGSPLESFAFPHAAFANGGILELWLGPEPDKSWGLPAGQNIDGP